MENNTYNNHFKFGWGTGIYNFDDNKTMPYWVEFGKVSRPIWDFRKECVNACRLIGETAKKPIAVCYSGGIDSEVIISSMTEAGVEYSALIVSLRHDGKIANSHDTEYAYSFVEKNNIPYIEYTLDFDDYVRNRSLSDVELYQSPRLGILVHSDIVRTFCKDYLCILGGGDINMSRSRLNGYPDTEGMFISEEQTSVSPIHAASLLGENVVNRFFMYTPELMLSWLVNEDIKTFVKYERSFVGINSYKMKPFVLHKLWPELTPRPKFTGYEHIPLFDKNKWNTCDPELVSIFSQAINATVSKTHIDIQYDDLLKILQ